MKVGYYIRRCSGDIVINIVSNGNGKLLRYGTAENMNANMEASFKLFEGFSDSIWEMDVKDFRIIGNRLDLIV